MIGKGLLPSWTKGEKGEGRERDCVVESRGSNKALYLQRREITGGKERSRKERKNVKGSQKGPRKNRGEFGATSVQLGGLNHIHWEVSGM